MPILEVNNLQTAFRKEATEVIAVDDVSFKLIKGKTLGVVGESGCGKSITSLSIMGLLGKKGYVKKGSIHFNNQDLTKINESEYRSIRGNDISMIFQEPMTSLNPVLTIENQMLEGIQLHLKLPKKEARQYAIEMLGKVKIPRPADVMKEYPHQLSGGMRQRVVIAMALACNPKIVIADEPTTALDVTIQAQILQLMKELKEELSTAIMFITHDLGVIAEMADQVIVMYAGQIVEQADVYTLFREPKHPYTQGLMSSIPHLDTENEQRLISIPGTVPTLQNMPQGCRFKDRCQFAQEKCNDRPPLINIDENHLVRCWLVEKNEG